MAQGDLHLFNEYSDQLLKGTHNLAAGGDTIKVALITTLPLITQTTPTLSDFTEVSGGTSYVAGGASIAAGQSVSQVSGSNYKYDSTTNPSWSQDGSGPTNIVAALIYNTSASNVAIGFIDMTVDAGSTPISLQAGNVSITWNASGIIQVS